MEKHYSVFDLNDNRTDFDVLDDAVKFANSIKVVDYIGLDTGKPLHECCVTIIDNYTNIATPIL